MDMDLDKPATGRHDDPAFCTHRSPDLLARHLQRRDGVSTTTRSYVLRICLHVVCNWRAQPSSWGAPLPKWRDPTCKFRKLSCKSLGAAPRSSGARVPRRSGVLHAAAANVRFRPEPYRCANSGIFGAVSDTLSDDVFAQIAAWQCSVFKVRWQKRAMLVALVATAGGTSQ